MIKALNEKSRNRLHDREGVSPAVSIPDASVSKVHSGADRAKDCSPVRYPRYGIRVKMYLHLY